MHLTDEEKELCRRLPRVRLAFLAWAKTIGGNKGPEAALELLVDLQATVRLEGEGFPAGEPGLPSSGYYEIFVTTGDMYHSVRRYDEAVAAYTVASKVNPTAAHNRIAKLYLARGKHEQAVEHLELVLAGSAIEREAATSLCRILAQGPFKNSPKHLAMRIETIERLVNADRPHADDCARLAEALWERGADQDDERATELVSRAQRINAESPLAYRVMATRLHRGARFEEADQLYQRALETKRLRGAMREEIERARIECALRQPPGTLATIPTWGTSVDNLLAFLDLAEPALRAMLKRVIVDVKQFWTTVPENHRENIESLMRKRQLTDPWDATTMGHLIEMADVAWGTGLGGRIKQPLSDRLGTDSRSAFIALCKRARGGRDTRAHGRAAGGAMSDVIAAAVAARDLVEIFRAAERQWA